MKILHRLVNPLGLSLVILALSLTPCLNLQSVDASSVSTSLTASPYLADDVQLSHPVMVMTPDQHRQRHNKWINAPKAQMDDAIGKKLTASPSFSSINNLSKVTYTASQRDQGNAGNCWVWAGTAPMEAALKDQLSVSSRLSIQYLDSNYNNGAVGNWAGCGGDMNDLVSFYSSKKIAVPWSNTNASYQDGSRTCALGTAVSASSITTTPSYAISSITDSQISTFSVSQATAIANIKNVLNQGKVAVFCFYLSRSDWTTFDTFWNGSSEATLWSGGFSSGQTIYAGHAVACVGYNDDSTDTSQHYWIMLNSWGTTTNRPNGLFRIPIYYNYQTVDSSSSANTEWWTVNPTYTASTTSVPAAPTLSSPTSGATVTGTSITFQWSAVTSATSYVLSVVKTSDHSIFFSQVVGNVTSYSVSGFPNNGTQYVWAAGASNSAGWGPASSGWTFTNGTSSTVSVPAAPTLSSPASGATVTGTSITFQWGAVTGATSYVLSVVKTSDHSIFFSQVVGNVTNYSVSGFPNNGTQYVWAAGAYNSAGWGPASSGWTFTNGTAASVPAAPTLSSPTNGATVSSTSVTFTWNAPSGATSYILSVVKTSDNSTFFNQVLGNVTSYSISGFPNNGTQYRWTVSAGNSAGYSAASTGWTFTNGTTVSVPSAPTLSSPTSGATISSTSVTFTWNASSGATSYILSVVKTSDNSTFFNQVLGNVTSYSVSGFPNNGTPYRWTVSAGNSAGYSAASSGWTFTNGTTASVPSAPTLSSPASGATVSSTSITFQWGAVTSATGYVLTVVKNSDHSIFFSQVVGNVTSYIVSGFPNNGTQYIWAVTAGNNAGWGPASSGWIFTNGTTVSVPSAPTLSSPTNSAKVTDTSITLQWGAVTSATSYVLSIVKTSDHSVFFSQVVGNVTSYTVSGFPNNSSQYVWAVGAGNSAGWGPSSSGWYFTNGP